MTRSTAIFARMPFPRFIRYLICDRNIDVGICMGASEDISIKQAQEEVEKFLEERGKDWTQMDNHFYVFTHLIEEIGELARHIINVELNLSLDRTSREPMPRKDALYRIEDDLGDILYHILKLAVAYDIDLANAFEKAMLDIKERYGKKKI